MADTPLLHDRYRIVRKLGSGAFATVYLADDLHMGRPVAIKLLPVQLALEPRFLARFKHEAQVVAALEHPAIVPVYDFGEEDGRPYLVMRLMTGGTLSDKLKLGPLSIEHTTAILGRIGSALERAHNKGIIHRDLKPDNIFQAQGLADGGGFADGFVVGRIGQVKTD